MEMVIAFTNNDKITYNSMIRTWIEKRMQYLSYYYTRHVRKLGELAGVEVRNKIKPLSESKNPLKWGDINYHLSNRIVTSTQLFKLLPKLVEKKHAIDRIIDKGYKLSLLPLNYLLGHEVYNQFIPPEDYYLPHITKSIDPYGIYKSDTCLINVGKEAWLASYKFPHTLLVNIHGYCPIGCSDCYKSYYTRECHTIEMGVNDIDDASAKGLTIQLKNLVHWLNKNPEVYDVIISGGEPLVRSNDHIRIVLSSLRHAKHLKILRLCTGTLFLGLPFRFDDNLLDIMEEFEQDTAIRIRIHAHISNWKQISPEAVVAVCKIRARGIPIYTQVPIREGLNYFSDDLNKTLDYFVRLGKTEAILGLEPYMFIADMHPRTNRYYVAIEPLLKLWCALVETHNYPGIERPRSLSILCEQGNVILSGPLILAMRKFIDKESSLISYQIPAPSFLSGQISDKNITEQRFLTYREPLIEGKNDDPNSLSDLQRIWNKSCKR